MLSCLPNSNPLYASCSRCCLWDFLPLVSWDGPSRIVSWDSWDNDWPGDTCFGLILLFLTISSHVPLGEGDLSSVFPVFSSSSTTISAQDPLGKTNLLGTFSETSSTTIGENVAGDWVLLLSILSSLFWVSRLGISLSSDWRVSNWLLMKVPFLLVGLSWVFSCPFPELLVEIGFVFFPLFA